MQVVLFVVIGLGGLAALGASPSSLSVAPVRLVVGGLAVVAGGTLALLATVGLGSSLSPFPKPVARSALVTSGVYAKLRHPIYSGILLAAAGWTTLTASVVALAGSILLCLLFDAKSRREEALLAARHVDYPAYRARTKRFIPYVY